ncbi:MULTISPECIES: DUF1415 domain-containing protein [Halomonas]|uniref:DUF1415 domain-containing protein n=2 Tax=Halomonas halophila TaxID=29573 RepID=A0ABQ0U7U2_9GAMM|nr:MULTISPECIES: DUF1415 domain-containing protein [Halomonas]MDR5891069.1 DUF1415 domain-containing protein [Halomonas salina]WJY08324.1 DUF1415 domain-containing protein [Halomonas halophila]GEK74589.1 DUF1415 domain-containing protein [Halomonas halophila]
MTASVPSPLEATRAWVETFVVGLEVCPFAGREVTRDSIRYVEVDATDPAAALMKLMEECWHLDEHAETETTLMVLSEGLADFDDYLDALGMAEALLEEQGYEGIYQLASFHPDYEFEGEAGDSPRNFTNRSPWPMWHLIREAGLERALAHYPDPEAIPERNAALMEAKGHQALAASLAALRGASGQG